MMLAAHDELSTALESDAFFEGTNSQQMRGAFHQSRNEIANHVDVAEVRTKVANLPHVLSGSKQEQAYRRWCLDQRLFLNPLNDLGSLPVADHDVLTTPSVVRQKSTGQ
jgi:hypothetical protein